MKSFMNFRKTTLTLGVLFALGSGAAMANSFEALDTDGDGKLTKEEYSAYMNDPGIYRTWDRDHDGLIMADEFDRMVDVEYISETDFVDWDVDQDGYIDPGEFSEATFVAYDADGSGFWDDGEWNSADKAGLFHELTSVDETLRDDSES